MILDTYKLIQQKFSLPFLLHAQKFAGEEYEAFIESLGKPPSLGIRINPYKRDGIFSGEERIPWSTEGRYLDERPSFTLDPLFHAGCYYVQDASSQFLEQPFLQSKKNFNRPIRILDMCAAPGGKSTHILSMIGDDDLLVCNEIIGARNSILRQNIMKWGKANVVVTQNDPSDFSRLEGFFDIVIVDAPCSGEGLFRKDENAREEWSEENIKNCTFRQKEILKHAYTALQPGGFIIYSTCTFEEEENDIQMDLVLEKTGMKLVEIENVYDGLVKTRNGLLFFPHRIHGEGFYISLLQKEEGANTFIKKANDKGNDSNKKYLNRFLKNADDFYSLLKDDRLFAIPMAHVNAFNFINRNFYIRLGGIYMGDFKGEELIPSAALALTDYLNEDIPKVILEKEFAIEYLRGGNIPLNETKGWAVGTYNNFSLGWMKNIGTRMNNYYPKEWRIKLAN